MFDDVRDALAKVADGAPGRDPTKYGGWITVAYAQHAIAELQARGERIAALEQALRELLADTQHAKHKCGDADCPVDLARAALGEQYDG